MNTRRLIRFDEYTLRSRHCQGRQLHRFPITGHGRFRLCCLPFKNFLDQSKRQLPPVSRQAEPLRVLLLPSGR